MVVQQFAGLLLTQKMRDRNDILVIKVLFQRSPICWIAIIFMKIKTLCLKNIKKYKKFLKREKDSIRYSSGIVVLKKGEEVGEHKTDNVEEVIVVLEGETTIFVEGKKYKKLKSPSVVYIPQNVVHNVVNNSSKVLKYIYITSKLQ
jgi:quercetin dioxygenase-like cupin family protein